jgi:magnesium chelatase subunit I
VPSARREELPPELGLGEKASLSQSSSKEDKLPKSVVYDSDSSKARLIGDAINSNLSVFIPDLLFEKFVKNFKSAKDLFGESFVRALFGFDSDYIEKNINLPEFRKILRENLEQGIKELKNEELIDEENRITEQGFKASVIDLYLKELDRMSPFSGKRLSTKDNLAGLPDEIVRFTNQSFRDLAVKGTVKKAARRSHVQIKPEDLVMNRRVSTKQAEIIVCIDASSSMKGEKIQACKKASVMLAYSAIRNGDKVGLLVFSEKVSKKIRPTRELFYLIEEISRIRTTSLTDISTAISESIELFSRNASKNIFLITDAMPTKGKKPVEQAVSAAISAMESKIHISLIGIAFNKESEGIARQIVDASRGSLYSLRDIKNLNKVFIEEYYSLKHLPRLSRFS